MVIYKITNKVNGKIYIGQTVRSMKVRLMEHKRPSKNSLLAKSMRRYGIENFKVELIDEAYTIEELNNKEIYYIKKFNCIYPNGYNLCCGGGNTEGYKYTSIARSKMSSSRKGKYTGENNHFYGKKHTEETKKKMKDAFKDKEFYAKRCEHLSKVRYIGGKRVRNIDTGEIFDTIKDACISIGKTEKETTHISRVCRGKRRTCFGYRWEYVD